MKHPAGTVLGKVLPPSMPRGHDSQREVVMQNRQLWDVLRGLKSEWYDWVDLTHELGPQTPHWHGFDPLKAELLYDYRPGTPADQLAPMRCWSYTVASQYGTHVDVPLHFFAHGRSMTEFTPQELVMPLVVVDLSATCAADPEYLLTVDDLEEWEFEHGVIPRGAFVAFRSDWSKKPDPDNPDAKGRPRYPGWDVDAIRWLVDRRDIAAIGHETADTDPSFVTSRQNEYPYPAERYLLSRDRFQVELMANLDKVPSVGSIIMCAFPKLERGTGFSARCLAICPR
jgi:kynurenine formamidase